METINNQRKDFIIIALAGITGSGCSAFSEAMLFGDRYTLGAIDETFYKLYQPFMPYKDELVLWEKRK